MEYDNTNRGALWGNKNRKSDKHPEFTGKINVEGKDYWISGWKRREDQPETAPALSLSVQAMEDRQPTPVQQAPAQHVDEDDIPW